MAEPQAFLPDPGGDTLQDYLLALPMLVEAVMTLSELGKVSNGKTAAPDAMALI